MRDADLPLFEWQPPCKVVLFPLVNRIGKVRHTAAILSRKHGEDATLYWKQVVASNRKHMARVGLSEVQAELEICAFFDAVRDEIVRMGFERRSGGDYPGGAA